ELVAGSMIVDGEFTRLRNPGLAEDAAINTPAVAIARAIIGPYDDDVVIRQHRERRRDLLIGSGGIDIHLTRHGNTCFVKDTQGNTVRVPCTLALPDHGDITVIQLGDCR